MRSKSATTWVTHTHTSCNTAVNKTQQEHTREERSCLCLWRDRADISQIQCQGQLSGGVRAEQEFVPSREGAAGILHVRLDFWLTCETKKKAALL